MLKKLVNTLRNYLQSSRDIFPNIKYSITEAFELKGVKYYQMDDITSAPYERALKALSFYKEFKQRVDDKYLDKHLEAEKAIFNSGQPTHTAMAQLFQLHQNLEERRKYIIDTDLVYKLASVVYFDANEDPRVYDAAYNAKKIELWKTSLSVNDFFYSAPILKLIPFLEGSKQNLDQYSILVAQAKQEHLKRINKIISQAAASSGK